jgi:hypothetical protein
MCNIANPPPRQHRCSTEIRVAHDHKQPHTNHTQPYTTPLSPPRPAHKVAPAISDVPIPLSPVLGGEGRGEGRADTRSRPDAPPIDGITSSTSSFKCQRAQQKSPGTIKLPAIDPAFPHAKPYPNLWRIKSKKSPREEASTAATTPISWVAWASTLARVFASHEHGQEYLSMPPMPPAASALS